MNFAKWIHPGGGFLNWARALCRSSAFFHTLVSDAMYDAHAQANEYTTLVLGAWGCGAFDNDVARTARDFHDALTNEFSGAFSAVVFAITDWSPERKFLGPFRDAFNAGL